MDFKHFYRVLGFAVASFLPLVGTGVAWADVFNMPAGQTSLETVPVGSAGNTPDTMIMSDATTGYGSVACTYRISKYDVTAAQYCAFLNAVAATDNYGLYFFGMVNTNFGSPGITQSGSPGSFTYSVASGRANKPVTDMSFWNACRFANWLSNGQPSGPEGSGTTETGTYTLTPDGIAGNTVTRNAGSTWAVASENEWYKAAYYDPTLKNGTGGYWEYPTQSHLIDASMGDFSGSDSTDVGSYPYPSYYGTFDQGGNVWQWTEANINESREIRGGSFLYSPGLYQLSSSRYPCAAGPGCQASDIGFRVTELPEPASLAILGFGVVGLLARQRGRRS